MVRSLRNTEETSRPIGRAVPVDAKAYALRQKAGIVIVSAALCVVTAGCARDTQAAPSKKSEASSQMRYYGGPKSPMWSGQ
jgi:hypothetical protein